MVLRFLAAVLLASLASGCTVIGAVTGALSDARRPDWEQITCEQLSEIEAGVTLSVVTRNGSQCEGHFAGVGEEPVGEYQRRFAVWKQATGSTLPGPGDTLALYTLRRHTKAVVPLAGYKRKELVVESESGKGGLIHVTLANLSQVIGPRGVFDPAMLDSTIAAMDMPVMNMFRVTIGDDTLGISFDQTKKVEKRVTKNALLFGVVCGAALDMAVYIALKSAPSPGWKLF